MPEIHIDVTDAGVRAALRHLQETASDLKPVLTTIGNTVLARVQEGFKSST